MTKQKRFIVSITFGLLLTFVLAFIAFAGKSKSWVCTFAWQWCLTYNPIYTPDNPAHEGSVLDFIGFFYNYLGLLLGIPIYGVLTYVALTLIAKFKK